MQHYWSYAALVLTPSQQKKKKNGKQKKIKNHVLAFFFQPRPSFYVCTTIAHLSSEYLLSIVISLCGWHIRLCAVLPEVFPPLQLVLQVISVDLCASPPVHLYHHGTSTSTPPAAPPLPPYTVCCTEAEAAWLRAKRCGGIVLTSRFDSGNSAAGTQRLWLRWRE